MARSRQIGPLAEILVAQISTARADSDPFEGLAVSTPVNGAATLAVVHLLNTSTTRRS